jgi:hypothetical protein
MSQREWLHSPVTWLLIIAGYEVAAVALVWGVGSYVPRLEQYEEALFFVPPVFVLAMLFFHFFTLPIPDSGDSDHAVKTEAIRNDLIRYAFVFMFVAVGLAIVPFFLFTGPAGVEQHPIAFFVGCSSDRDPGTELACSSSTTDPGKAQNDQPNPSGS